MTTLNETIDKYDNEIVKDLKRILDVIERRLSISSSPYYPFQSFPPDITRYRIENVLFPILEGLNAILCNGIVGGKVSEQEADIRIIDKNKFNEVKKNVDEKYKDMVGNNKVNKESSAAKEAINDIRLDSQKVIFNNHKAIIEIGNIIIQIPPNKNEHYFCRAMFVYKANKPIDWSVIYEKITGYYKEFFGKPQRTRQNWRIVYDAMDALNHRIRKAINTEDNLFTWQEKTVKRNY